MSHVACERVGRKTPEVTQLSLTGEISWSLLQGILKDWLGRSVELEGVKSLHGGSMSTTLLLDIKGRRPVVIKIAPHMVMHQYEHEAYQLNLLRDWGLSVPQVYACRVATLDEPHSYLLMQQMPGRSLADVRESLSPGDLDHVQMHLADIVLAMHGRTSGTYKRVDDGGGEETTDYLEFFHNIYDPILADVIAMKLIAPGLRRRVCNIHEKATELLRHSDRPRLIHGDLWASNLLVDQDKQGRWWISAVLDPNCRYSHAELELAYLELFKTVTPAFFRVYRQALAISEEYRLWRRDLYMIYTLLNHVRLFGKQYAQPLEVVAERLAKTLRGRGGHAAKARVTV